MVDLHSTSLSTKEGTTSKTWHGTQFSIQQTSAVFSIIQQFSAVL